MVNGFQITSIWVKYERSVISWVVLRAKTRCSVVGTTSCQRGAVECIHARLVSRSECDMHVTADWFAFTEPKIWFLAAPEANMIGHVVRTTIGHQAPDPKRCKRLFVERD